ncbi:uncharacterized protein LOC117215350 [Bombus bifarius]|uniref:Uncharacterized protein LOC117215350 n=1 Tax=Bombus bifarius TaxID=103933 RepID=A0A6P8MUR7_9HYME|nr:uncharacterized protein LOC117215350 [Bombus bifarius]XP_033317606.1 uncharacterized protein LOC117215350 [Bombus bifarius]XP_033317607.1 uncharacterized protein LOC117215350 [Bombus bifarius]
MMPPIIGETLRVWFLSALVVHGAVAGNPDAKRLYDDLLSNYNKLVRPVVNTSDVLRVCIKLKLSQLIDVVVLDIRQAGITGMNRFRFIHPTCMASVWFTQGAGSTTCHAESRFTCHHVYSLN